MTSVLCDDPYKAALFLDTEKVNSSLGSSFDDLHLKYYYNCEFYIVYYLYFFIYFHDVKMLLL